MISQFTQAGFESCGDDPEDVPDVLVVAFDKTLEYSRLCRAAWWASQGMESAFMANGDTGYVRLSQFART